MLKRIFHVEFHQQPTAQRSVESWEKRWLRAFYTCSIVYTYLTRAPLFFSHYYPPTPKNLEAPKIVPLLGPASNRRAA